MLKAMHLQKLWKSDVNTFHIHALFRILAIVLGVLHAFAAIKSQSMNADGISYLDIGDAYFRADWATAINAVWSPLYSWILGFVNLIFKPAMAWEFPAVHIVNFLIYLFALASFEYMWRHVRATKEMPEVLPIPEPFWWALGYLLFIWTSLSLIQLWAVTPDMLMATFVFLAAGLIAQIRAGRHDLYCFLKLGLVLGLGYLSKTFMFSTALVFLVLAWLVQKWSWSALKRISPAVGIFLLMSLPYIALISNEKGRFTIGEAGMVTYVRHVIGIPYPHWQGDPINQIAPTHLSRLIHEDPAIYEFGEPVHGTYAIGLDPSYWYEGIDLPFEFKRLVIPLLPSGMYYLELFFQKQGILLACVLVLYSMGQRRKWTAPEILRRWALVIPAVAAFGLYALVLVEDRYIGAFLLLFWSDVLANIQLPEAPHNSRWIKVTSLVAAIGLLVAILLFNMDGFVRLNPALESGPAGLAAPPASPLAVARSLKELGIQPGEKVGVIGYAYDSFWARLARVRIVAEMLEADAIEDLWRGDESLQQSVLQAFAGAGVAAVIAEYVPKDVELAGWHRVGTSSYFIYLYTEQ